MPSSPWRWLLKVTPSTWGVTFLGSCPPFFLTPWLSLAPVRSLDTVLVTLCDPLGICPSTLPDYFPVTLHTVSGGGSALYHCDC